MAQTRKEHNHINMQGHDITNIGNVYDKPAVDARTVDLSGVQLKPRDGKKNDNTGLSKRIQNPAWSTLTAYLNALVTETRKNLQGLLLFARKVRFMEHEYGRYLRTASYSFAATVGTFYRLRTSPGAAGEHLNQNAEINALSYELIYIPDGAGKRLYTNGVAWRSITLNVGAEARITVTNSGNGIATTIKLVARVVDVAMSSTIETYELDRISFTAGTTAQSLRLFGSDLLPIFQNASAEYGVEFALVVSAGANNTVQVDSAKMYFHKAGWYRGQKVF